MNRQKTEKVTVTRSLLQRFAAAPYTVWAVLFIVHTAHFCSHTMPSPTVILPSRLTT